jgi:predicted ATPase with chaperone activity
MMRSHELFDRIDIEVPALGYQELASKDAGENSDVIRARVNPARSIQLRHGGGLGILFHDTVRRELDQYRRVGRTMAHGYTVTEVAKYLRRDPANISTMLSWLSAREKEPD